MRQKEYEAFFDLALADLVLVEKNLKDPDIRPQILLFHLQQAAEKLLKALLSFRGLRFPRTHDIAELAFLCERDAHVPLPEWVEELFLLNPFAVEFRYGLLVDEVPDVPRLFERTVALRDFVAQVLRRNR